jgi:hypothetical protein
MNKRVLFGICCIPMIRRYVETYGRPVASFRDADSTGDTSPHATFFWPQALNTLTCSLAALAQCTTETTEYLASPTSNHPSPPPRCTGTPPHATFWPQTLNTSELSFQSGTYGLLKRVWAGTEENRLGLKCRTITFDSVIKHSIVAEKIENPHLAHSSSSSLRSA